MTQGPNDEQWPPPPPPLQPYLQAPRGQVPPYQQQGYFHPSPYGVHPVTGVPYSPKSKVIAGILQILLPLGLGRLYMGNTGVGVAQFLVVVLTCGVGALWPLIDGILILVGDPVDERGQPLRS